jgi:hypothetical protein
MALSYLTVTFLLFYMVITMRDYIVRPPELVSQGDIDLLQVAREIPFHVAAHLWTSRGLHQQPTAVGQ